MPDALVVIDMQEAAIAHGRQHDLAGVINRINRLISAVRAANGTVIFVRHDRQAGDPWAPHSAGWQIAASLDRVSTDHAIRKRTNDAFYQTDLAAVLHAAQPERVLLCGWATDFCVDSSVRSAAARGFSVLVAADAHTCDDRAHLYAVAIIAHNNATWPGLIAPGGILVRSVGAICVERSV